MKLGILYHKGKIVNHRSLLKVLLNPILRYCGCYIGSVCEDNRIKGLKLKKCKRAKKNIYDFNSYNDHDRIERKRMII